MERIDRDGAVAEPFIDDRSFEVVVHEVRPKVDEEERAERPGHKHDRTKCEQLAHAALNNRPLPGSPHPKMVVQPLTVVT
jgi:hypothetical protein